LQAASGRFAITDGKSLCARYRSGKHQMILPVVAKLKAVGSGNLLLSRPGPKNAVPDRVFHDTRMSRGLASMRATDVLRGFAAAAVVLLFSLGSSTAQAGEGADLQATANAAASDVGDYHLDVGDKVKVTVYGEDDLSGEFQIDGAGNVDMPMIREVHAAGMTTKDFAHEVQDKLQNGHFLVNPRVSAEVTNYRPFTILGEVNKPGEYPYENGMSVLNAVALAGGWTYRADEQTVYVRRKGATHESAVSADDKTLVNPGDTIRVTERIF
jgi:polysaccharide export outer membrane protein